MTLISLYLFNDGFSPAPSSAQDDATVESTCAPMLKTFYLSASDACLGKMDGHICNGGNPPLAEPTGPVSNSLAPLGALVAAEAVTALTTTAFAEDGSSGGLAWLRFDTVQVDALSVGDVSVRDATPPGMDLPLWQVMEVRTSESKSACEDIPPSSFLVQSAVGGVASRVVINGTSIDLLGSLLVQTQGNQTVFVALSGTMRLIANSQSAILVAGQQSHVEFDPANLSRALTAPAAPLPLDSWRINSFPVELMDRATILPQPGFVETEGLVNMRAAPSLNGALLAQVPAGTMMTVLGRNEIGDWYHVRLPSGETGWMYAELLRRQHGALTAIYNATPVPPQRYGELGTKALVLSPNGATVRSAPDVGFNATYSLAQGTEVNLLARSPYSPWVKVDAAGVTGWVALIALETQAIIASLPIDYDVPPPPGPTATPVPTRVPGSWGGAFPDPDCYPNCN